MNFCRHCVLPDTRPNLQLDNKGICNACRSSETKSNIDWEKRKNNFEQVIKSVKAKNRGYDCLIPVSGGKDSHWQVIKCLEYGLNPLAVTWKTPARTEIGVLNLENLISLGVDHIDFQINPKVERNFLYQALVKYGATAIPMHMALFNIPLNIAMKFDIPLIVWGENSAFEYGSANDSHKGFQLNQEWLKNYGVTHGTTANDWIGEDLSRQELTPYFGPTDKELQSKDIRAVFLGYYFEWSPDISLESAKKHGFKVREQGARTGYYNYADIDDKFISIHHYLKWYKFGFTRTFDNLSIEIRNGNITRDKAIEIIKKRGEEKPLEDIRALCEFLNITEAHFFDVIERFRNLNIWHKKNGKWQIKDFLINDWKW